MTESVRVFPQFLIDSVAWLIEMPVQFYLMLPDQQAIPVLEVIGPSGRVEPDVRDPLRYGGRVTHRWEYVPAETGSFEVIVRVQGGVIHRAAMTIIDRPLSPIEAVIETIPAPLNAQLQPVRGAPRNRYSRTYMLLPEQAGREWVEAIITSQAWQRNRWTIGYSADDAGIGDLDSRTVLIVNPSAWAEPIESWFSLWYPGVITRSLYASTPDQLRSKLDSLSL